MRGFYILLLALVAAGSSKADLGEIDTFEITVKTEDTITIKWTLGPTDQPPIKYTVSEDGFINIDVQCTAPCEHTFEFLQQCTQHKFEVTPWYMVNGAPTSTLTAEINGTTQGAAPLAPSGLVAVDHNHNVDLSWTAPADMNCLDHWQVCYKLKGSIEDTCETTNLDGITLHGLDKCAEMIATIKGVTPGGIEGKPLAGHFKMGYGDPSPVRNLTVGDITNTTVELKWNDPATNPKCIQKYSINYGQNNTAGLYKTEYYNDVKMDFDNHATISDLFGCTIYQFDVSPLSTEGFEAPSRSVTAETFESYPLDISAIHVDYEQTPGSLIVNWSPNPKDACQSTWKICYHDEINPAEDCFPTDGANGETYEIQLQLEACTKYDVGVSGVSPSGMVGNFSYFSVYTWDEEPGAVKDLIVASTDVNMIEVSFNDPDVNARCVDRYDVEIRDMTNGEIKSNNMRHDDYLTDLDACTDYEITVFGVTRTGKKSPEAQCQGATEEGPLSAPRSFAPHDNNSEVTETSISLVWYEPSINSRCAGSYKLTWTGTGEGTEPGTATIGNGSHMPYQVIHTVVELACGGEYDFTLEVFSLSGVTSSESPVTLHAATLPCSL